jgi:hypothetical protein
VRREAQERQRQFEKFLEEIRRRPGDVQVETLAARLLSGEFQARRRAQPHLETLGLDHWPVTRLEVEAAFRRKAATSHPDRGGNREEFECLTAARDYLLGLLDPPVE